MVLWYFGYCSAYLYLNEKSALKKCGNEGLLKELAFLNLSSEKKCLFLNITLELKNIKISVC